MVRPAAGRTDKDGSAQVFQCGEKRLGLAPRRLAEGPGQPYLCGSKHPKPRFRGTTNPIKCCTSRAFGERGRPRRRRGGASWTVKKETWRQRRLLRNCTPCCFAGPPPLPSPSSWASYSSSAPSIKARTRSTTTSTRGNCGNTSSTSMRRSSSLEAPIEARRTRSTQQLFAQSWRLSLKMMLKLLFMDHRSLLARNGFTYKTDSLPSAVFEVCLVSMLRK
ncbi:PREDICTED: uncharacterized protein LOC105575706 isoform X1 [Cercocebus atys]|uniref:uncharacterized protein LOC105575706 isoform X1 n=1 Tax=Cercocebus atys TaxID=9531 RepID=UPI0005F4803F|nr:PREDICTED: uncharacterized protein LOC105575706 isoform X1 [Cercocebus atys]